MNTNETQAITSAISLLQGLLTPPPAVPSFSITSVVPNVDSFTVVFSAPPGVTRIKDFRVCPADPATDTKCKAQGGVRPGSLDQLIEINGMDWLGIDLVVEALDALTPYVAPMSMMGPATVAMPELINGHNPATVTPNVLARSLPFRGVIQAQQLQPGETPIFFDTFQVADPFVPVPVQFPMPADIALKQPTDYAMQQNANWFLMHYLTDTTNSKAFIDHDHLMTIAVDGGGPGSSLPAHNANASLILSPRTTFAIPTAPGDFVRITFEVDAHVGSRRWPQIILAPDTDTLINPGKFAQGDGGNNIATTSGKCLRWQIQPGYHTLYSYHDGKQVDLLQPTDPFNDLYFSVSRRSWKSLPDQAEECAMPNSDSASIDRRHRFDLYLNATEYIIIESDHTGPIRQRRRTFPVGESITWANSRVYFIHQIYHLAIERLELTQFLNPAFPWDREDYWLDCPVAGEYDERHWDNFGISNVTGLPSAFGTQVLPL